MLVGRRTVFAVRCTADPEQVRALRAGIGQWLTGLEWPEDDRDDVVLAASEAFENAVAHAYPPGISGAIDVLGRTEAVEATRRVTLRIADRGRWRPPPPDQGFRGHGLKVMRECVDQLHIDHSPLGTVVKLASRGVPLVDPATVSAHIPPLRRGQPARIVALPAADEAGGQRHRRREEIMLTTKRLQVDARSLSADAAAAWLRAQDVMRASSRLCTDARRICSHLDGTREAA